MWSHFAALYSNLIWAQSLLKTLFLKKILFILFLDRGEGREKERERNVNVGDLAHNPGLCPD